MIFPEALDMHIHRLPGIANVFVAPYMIQQLLPGEDLNFGRGSQEIQKLQLLGGHIHRVTLVEDRIIGLVDNEIRVFSDT